MLGVAGVALLFASDELLPVLVAGFPPAGSWLGQLLGAAWLGVAVLNWLQRRTVLGGIYGRPIVLTNLTLYFVSALSLLRSQLAGHGTVIPWLLFALCVTMALTYGILLLRGPLDPLGPTT